MIRDLLRFAQGKAKEGDARFRRSLESLTGQVGMDLDHAQFIRSLAERLGGHRPTEADSEDLAYALHLLAGYEFRLMELLAAEETGEVVPSALPRFEELDKELGFDQELKERERRHRIITDLIWKRPGLYVAELYDVLRRRRAIKVSYPTIWNDAKFLESQQRLITIGGPQGSPRYCFPHPRMIEDRKVYYRNFYGMEGVVEEWLTDRFEPRADYLDLLLVNSHEKPLILALRIGVTRPQLVGEKVKAFGKLFGHDFLDRFGSVRVPRVTEMDVLHTINLTRIVNERENPVWYDREALAGLSLYGNSTMAGMR